MVERKNTTASSKATKKQEYLKTLRATDRGQITEEILNMKLRIIQLLADISKAIFKKIKKRDIAIVKSITMYSP